MRLCLLLLAWFTVGRAYPQKVITSDIDRFWLAYDQLASARSYEDSLRIMQEEYINQASAEFGQFIRLRNYSARAYVECLKKYPKFWESMRPLSMKVDNQKTAIDSLFSMLHKQVPNFQVPNICFGIGTLNSAGTQYDGTVLISAEMVAADSTVVRAELSPWLLRVIGDSEGMLAMIAHEAIHAQQLRQPRRHLLWASMSEGAADFLTAHLLGLNINQGIQAYGLENECRLWTQFRQDMKNNPADLSSWLYNGEQADDRPADLGYFIGYRIAEAYYQQKANKEKAIRMLLNPKKYGKVFRQSRYGRTCR